MAKLNILRDDIRTNQRADASTILTHLISMHGASQSTRQLIAKRAVELVSHIRSNAQPSMMELFLADYGLSSEEGIALMCLAEALLRVPDTQTINELIEDKIAPSDWGAHLHKSSSSLINASTWALMLTGKVLREPQEETLSDLLHHMIKRVGEPVIRTAVKRAMKEMGHQFVLGETIEDAAQRAKENEAQGYTYSYDMLGEAALTATDAAHFYDAYVQAIEHLASHAGRSSPRDNPGISIKLSALHPRYEVNQDARVIRELVPKVKTLALMAKQANMGLNIDAEEAERLDLSLDVIEAVLRAPELAGWDGFGVVVQAYGKRAAFVIDWLHALASHLDRKIMVRLVKGAYWDSEIKQAQVLGLADYPVFTSKTATDVAYICCAQKLLDYSDRIYPQFATHNAHSIAAILEMAGPHQLFEFQRLHGMGEAVHDFVLSEQKTRCRIYAPVGAHRDLLAYLVRRLLENGANSSFVNQLVDKDVPPEVIAADPFAQLAQENQTNFLKPDNLYQPDRLNSKGWDLNNYNDLKQFNAVRDTYQTQQWDAQPLVHKQGSNKAVWHDVFNPAQPSQRVGRVRHTAMEEAEMALQNGQAWAGVSANTRAEILNRAADLYEENAGELFAVLCREAGKTANDAVDEIREAVDFLRFYSQEGIRLEANPTTQAKQEAEQGLITCISPWNFPLAIFTGQIAAALAAGNGVLAKPADPTPITAFIATKLLHKAGVPRNVLQLLPGEGPTIGAQLTSDARVNGICFTGSTTVAQIINRAAAKHLAPNACFIAETGGLNAMIVDSTALPEQAVQDIINGAFRSAGQRCSALRVLYLQEDIASDFLKMLYGAMDELKLGDPWDLQTDVGPVITHTARQTIDGHIEQARNQGRLLKQLDAPKQGCFIGPAVIKVEGIGDLQKEIFGPVLHVATFSANALDAVITAINDSGFGLTFGLHTRIDSRVEHINKRLHVGNFYVNRNQIGAVVESQPFGGEGLSGTGPKAGGPFYVSRFKQTQPLPQERGPITEEGRHIGNEELQSALNVLTPSAAALKNKIVESRVMRGPTGELNRWSTHPRGTVLCLGPRAEDVRDQMAIAQEKGCHALGVYALGASSQKGDTMGPLEGVKAEGAALLHGLISPDAIRICTGFDVVAYWGTSDDAKPYRLALAERQGPILPLVMSKDMGSFCVHERHLCVDTTAVGGNTELMAEPC